MVLASAILMLDVIALHLRSVLLQGLDLRPEFQIGTDMQVIEVTLNALLQGTTDIRLEAEPLQGLATYLFVSKLLFRIQKSVNSAH